MNFELFLILFLKEIDYLGKKRTELIRKWIRENKHRKIEEEVERIIFLFNKIEVQELFKKVNHRIGG